MAGGQTVAMDPVLFALDEVFSAVPHTMFCVKGGDGRYLAINPAFAERAGRPANEILGRTARDVFPADLAESYEAQDAHVLATGEPLRHELELILRPDGGRGWYVTTKNLLRGTDGTVLGIVAVSHDLHTAAGTDQRHAHLQAAVDLARRHFAEPLRVADLAAAAGMSVPQLERATRRALGISPKQLVIRARIDEALRRLEDGDAPLSVVAAECGFYDQSSFTRLFRRVVGITPGAYRARVR